MWGIAPSEFWRMTMGEWYLLADHYEERAQAVKGPGPLTNRERDELLSLIDE